MPMPVQGRTASLRALAVSSCAGASFGNGDRGRMTVPSDRAVPDFPPQFSRTTERWYLRYVERPVRHLERLVADLTDAAQLASDYFTIRMEEVDVVGVIEASVEDVRTSARHRSPGPPHLQ